MLSVAGFMGLFHARLKLEEGSEREYVTTIGTRLEAANVSRDVVRRITENLGPAVRSLDSVVRVCNRDGHPGNWQIGDFGGILGVDLECDRVVPLTFDTANLVGQHDIVHGEDKYAVLREHLDCFRKYSDERIDIDYNVYKLAYLNSIIIRTLEIYSQVRVSNREVMVASLGNAEEAIDRISKDFTDYYQENEREYRELDLCLGELKGMN